MQLSRQCWNPFQTPLLWTHRSIQTWPSWTTTPTTTPLSPRLHTPDRNHTHTHTIHINRLNLPTLYSSCCISGFVTVLYFFFLCIDVCWSPELFLPVFNHEYRRAIASISELLHDSSIIEKQTLFLIKSKTASINHNVLYHLIICTLVSAILIPCISEWSPPRCVVHMLWCTYRYSNGPSG